MIEGVFFDGKISQAQDASLSYADELFTVSLASGETQSFAKNTSVFRAKIGKAPLTLEFMGGARFLSEDEAFLTLKHGLQGGNDAVHWLESNWPIAALLLVLVISFVFFFYRVILPPAARSLADHVPGRVTQIVSEQTIDFIEKSKLMSPSKLSLNMQFRVQLLTQTLNKDFPGHSVVILQRQGNSVKANAFALPNGSIYVTDQLVSDLSEDEFLAVLFHEMGHVELKHGLRSMIESSVLSGLLLTVSGNIDWTGLPVVLMTQGYSRKFEEEADAFSVATLKAHGMRTSLLSEALKKIDPNFKQKPSWLEFLSTHPSTYDRIKKMEN